MAMNGGAVTPADRLLAVFNLTMAVMWSSVVDTTAAAVWICAAHAAAATLPMLIARAGRLDPLVALLRHAYPLLWLLAFWTEVDPLRRALHTSANDGIIRAADIAVFGSQLHATWMPDMPFAWLSEPLHFAYFAYYLMIVLPLVVLCWQRRSDDIREAVFRLMLTYTVCFTSYALFPVDGPHHLETMYQGATADGFWYRLVHLINDNGGSLGAAFPSSHAAGAVTIAFLGVRFFPRWVGFLLSIQAAAVVLATFYTQYHYAIDAAAGAAVAIVLQAWIAPALLRDGPDAVRVPRLPPARSFESGWREAVS